MTIDLEAKHIALLGKSSAFSKQELKELLEEDGAVLTAFVDHETDMVIEGHLLNPILEEQIDSLQHSQIVPVISLASFEQMVSNTLFTEGLVMSLKLANDQQRIQSYLQNNCLSDSVFLDLLALFNWGDETLFGSDENRDVCSAITRRFYPNVEKNHNIEYSPIGIYETVRLTSNGKLLETIALCDVLQQGFTADASTIEFKVLQEIALNSKTPQQTLAYLLQHDDGRLQVAIAQSLVLSESMIETLLQSTMIEVLKKLSSNPCVSSASKEILIENKEVARYLATYCEVNETLFERLISKNIIELGFNSSLNTEQISRLLGDISFLPTVCQNEQVSIDILSKLFDIHPELHPLLARNRGLNQVMIEKLLEQNRIDINTALAQNTACDSQTLVTLSTKEPAVVLGVAGNIHTPIDVLYQLHLDQRYNDEVKHNPSFGQAIKNRMGY